MRDYKTSIKDILNEQKIDKGMLVDSANLTEEEWFDENLLVKHIPLTEVESFLSEKVDVKVVLMDGSEISGSCEKVIRNLLGKIRELNIILIVCTKNPISRDTVFELLSGYRTSPLDIHGYTGAGIREYMRKNGYVLEAEKNIKSESQMEDDKETSDENKNILLESGNMTCQYLSWLTDFIHSELNMDFFVQAYKPDISYGVQEKNECDKAPFLSIITRTQGQRLEALREVFLSLAGQSCMDFEVLLMGHNIGSGDKENVIKVIEETPEYLRKRIRFVPVEGGNRSTPINCGFREARGEYAVILDDDDIVFDHWVSSFKEKAKEYPGSILHAYVIAQNWVNIKTEDGKEVLRAAGSPQNQFCRDFNVISELHGNYCPVLGLAFPLFPFRHMGICFDETLDTTEDWDYLMRMRSICGVVDIKEPTSMYRLWKNMDNSHSIHTQNEWDSNRKRVQDGFKKRPLYLSEQYIDGMIRLAANHQELSENNKDEKGGLTALYYSTGFGFNERDVITTGSNLALPDFRYEFTELDSLGALQFIRWDPYESGNIYIENLRINIITTDGRIIEKTMSQVVSNGLKNRNCIVFFHPDPQIVIHFRKKIQISKIIITGVLKKKIPVEMHNYLAMKYDTNIIHKVKKAVKSVGKKVLRK